MKKRKIYCVTILLALFLTAYSTFLSYGHKDANPNLLLMNVEAIASEEYFTKFANKYTTTWEEGPYRDILGRSYVYVYTETDCEGEGVVDCEFDFSESITYL